jgi:hypothetical protein
VSHDYQAGNILIYRPFEKARIGRELGRASDLKAAETFLASRAAASLVFPLEEQPATGQVEEERMTAGQDAERQSATQQPAIGQPTPEEQPATDGLITGYTQALRDKDRALSEMKAHYETLIAAEAKAADEAAQHLSTVIEALKQDVTEKDARITQLSLATLQGDLQREELMNELIEATAQPLALEAIEELDELRSHSADAQNELRVLKASYADLEGTNLVLLAEKGTLEIELAAALRDNAALRGAKADARMTGTLEAETRTGIAADSFTRSSNNAKELVLADASGSTIHIYHEFPALPKRSLRHKVLAQSRYISLALVAVLVIAYIAYLNSVLGAIQSAGIDIQPYSEAVIARLRELVGF